MHQILVQQATAAYTAQDFATVKDTATYFDTIHNGVKEESLSSSFIAGMRLDTHNAPGTRIGA